MPSPEQSALKRKIAAYHQLQLFQADDEDADDSFDEIETARQRHHRRFFAKSSGAAAASPSKSYSTSNVNDEITVIKETPEAASEKAATGILDKAGGTLLQSGPSATEGSPLTTPRPKRRRSGWPRQAEPSAHSLFSGLAFYYIPNDDIAPARRIRINKAQEFGAAWTRDMCSATHVIVDKHITFGDVEKTMGKQTTSRRAKPLVVNENYPLDCIQFRQILDPDQKKYFLRGQAVLSEQLAEGNLPDQSVGRSVAPLPLKPQETNPALWNYAPPPRTPDRGEKPSQGGEQGLGPFQPTAPEAGDGQMWTTPVVQAPQPQPSLGGVSPSTEPAQPMHSGKDDELTQYISLMQEFRDLPLDMEDGDDGRSARTISDDDEASSSDDKRSQSTPLPRPETRARRKNIAVEERFVCSTAGRRDENSTNPNARTIVVLQQMLHYYERVNDQWRTQGYRKAISRLKRQSHRITTEEEAFKLPTIGKRIAQKIEEIVTTDKLQRLEHAQNEAADVPLQLFLGIYGVGNRQAQQWIAQGHRTLDDLKQRAKLSANQAIGIEHYDDLNTRIPRREVEALGRIVKQAAEKIDATAELIVGGSHRRGSDSSGDIDLIVTRPGTSSTSELTPFLNTLVAQLQADGFLVARLASSRPGGEGSKWHGCCALPRIRGLNDEHYTPVWRRIDFLLVPETERGAALIYFTGNDIFNRSMRLLASRKGMRLNQRGLYKDVLRGPQRVKLTEGELLEGRDERKIFEILGVKWREPEERWC